MQRQAAALSVGSETFTITLRTPSSVPVTSVVLGAEGTLQIAPGSRVTSFGAITPPITNVGRGLCRAEPDVVLGDVWCAGPTDLRDRVHVTGSVHTPSLTRARSVTIDGALNLGPVGPPFSEIA